MTPTNTDSGSARNNFPSRPARDNRERRPQSGGRPQQRPSQTALSKTNARASDKAHFAVRRHVVDRDDGTPKGMSHAQKIRADVQLMAKGNLSNPYLSAALNVGPLIKTNSAPVFADGHHVRIIPLGGTSEVGMNMTVIECGEDIIIVDTGMGFGGGDKFPGVDYIIPDTEYLEQNKHKIRGLIYTHGHLDHIGAAPYILPKLGPVPIFGMPLTLALLRNRLMDFELENKLLAKVIELDKPLKLGAFTIQFFRLNHSIPDVVGLAIDTPMGRIVYATDWKFDNTPFDGQLSDYGKLAALGDEGVRLLITDSLGILKPGYSLSERDIGKTVHKIFEQSQGRIIFTTFSTSIARVQHVLDAAEKFGRKVAVTGRSMITNFKTCFELGYIRVPKDILVDFKEISKFPDHQVCVLATGSQGEDNAALSRMARDEHPTMKLQGGDSVIFSSSQIPGNEGSIQDLIARLSRKGVEVFSPKEFDTHVTGHACQEDLKMMMALTRPDYLQPVHGDHYMLKSLGKLGAAMGIKYDHNLIGENGRIIELRPTQVVLTDDVITENYLLVDGMSVGTVSEVVLKERRQMSTQGSIILVLLINKKKELVSGPEIISRGFVYMKNSGELFDKLKLKVREEFNAMNLDRHSATYFSELRNYLKKVVSEYVFQITEKDPMIIPVVVQM
ncbi:MAG: ribonuclease J [bacterium]